MACSLLNLSTDIAVCHTALYNTLYHKIFLVWVRQAAKDAVSSNIFVKTFATCNEFTFYIVM